MKDEKIILANTEKIFKEKFSKEPRKFFSPSRINIIGEHIDYNGGKVLPCAIEIGTYACAEKNSTNKICAYSVNLDSYGELDLDKLSYNRDLGWLNYLGGMAKFIKEAGYDFEGFDLVIEGNIPTGSGLSSSASLEVLVGFVISNLFNLNISNLDLAKVGMKTENEYLGLHTGIMDQFAIAMGRKGSAILLDTNTLDYSYIDVDLKDLEILILNTNKPRSLIESKYNERRQETQKALYILKDFVDIDNLCQLAKYPNWEDLLLHIEDKTLYKRARHCVEENLRVKEMVKAMEAADYKKMGRLLNESHKSLRDFYEVTGRELDAITEGARQVDGCLGARMTGAGFSGCAIALVEKNSIDEFSKKVKAYYKDQTGLDAEILSSNIGSGPREIL
ncbi:galactokinase [Neofamilia massiliensis]|uniref:galactokinase n=1 Tax=Neofamilia massiliensis TaxID=1673724 RepID=UPI0006BB6D72|nr:galactokinase [Neofamilia massiliensis]